MVNDTIDILDAKICNIGIEFKVVPFPGTNKYDLLVEANDTLRNAFTKTFYIGEPIIITDIYQIDNSKLEFLKATSKDSPIARFIDKKSSGIHHISLLVDHLQPALDYLKDQGVQLIDEKPRIGAEGLSIAFIDPKSSGGILVELCEKK